MSNPNTANESGNAIAPPRTGEWELSRLLQYPNERVRALAGFLRNQLRWTTRDSFTGEYVSHLYNYIERNPDGGYDFSRIHAGLNRDNHIAWMRFRQGTGTNPLRIIFVETREEFRRRVGERGMRVDGTFCVDFEHIQIRGGRSCFDLEIRTGRGGRHFSPGTCHSW